jgi:HAD superfamily hydrolase (TIGR01509 family)
MLIKNKPNIADTKAVLFDMDGVIIDSMPSHSEAWVYMFKTLGIEITEEDIYIREGIKPYELVLEFYKRDGMKISDDEINQIIKTKVEYFWDKYSPGLYGGIKNCLQKIKEKKYLISLVSGSTKENVFKVLNDFEIIDYFDYVVHSDLVTKGKPHPMSFIKAVEGLKLEAKNCICIENAPYGIRSAKDAGVYVCAIATTLSGDVLFDAGADAVINTHDEILNFLGIS